MRSKLRDFSGRSFADINREPNYDHERAHKNQRHKPGRDVPDTQRVIKRDDIIDRRAGVQKDLRQPRDQD